MTRRFGRGFKRDSQDYGYHRYGHHMGAAPVKQAEPTMTRFRGSPIWQAQVSECVGCSFRRCVQLWTAANDPGARHDEASDLSAYTLGRRQESAGVDPDLAPALVDEGSEPGLVLLAAQNDGIVSREDWPGPDHPNFDPANVNVDPPPKALVKAFECKGLDWFALPTRPSHGTVTQFRQACRDALLRFEPVMIAINADSDQYQNNRGDVITDLGPYPADHMNAMLDASSDDFAVCDNWWRNEATGDVWGADDGTYRITWDELWRGCEQAFAVRSVPLVRKAVAS